MDKAITISSKEIKAEIDNIPNEDGKGEIYFVHVVEHGQHEWTFKLESDGHPTACKGVIGIEGIDKVLFRNEYGVETGQTQKKYGYSWCINTTAAIWTKDKKHVLDVGTIKKEDAGKCRVKNNVAISMKYNEKTRDLSFKINDGEYLSTFQGKYIQRGKYRVKLGIREMNGSQNSVFKLISYQMTH